MLIINRRTDQVLWIDGTNIKITVLGIDNRGNVKLGIDAPKNVSVHRDEILRRLETPVSFAKK